MANSQVIRPVRGANDLAQCNSYLSGMSLFSEYTPQGFYDEMFQAPGRARSHYARLYRGLHSLSPQVFAAKANRIQDLYRAQGITFDHHGAEQTFPFDLLPRVIPHGEWVHLDAGLKQRVRALDMFAADIYGIQTCVRDGVVSAGLISTSGGYRREAHAVRPPGGRWIHLAGIDLVRGDDSTWRVLEDNARTPSGLSYVVQNRAFMRRIFSESFERHRIQPVDHAPQMLRDALAAAAPDGVANPRIALLTPGPFNAAYYEHAFLAQQMGVALVEGHDLVVRDRRLCVVTTSGRAPIDVLYRRIDDDYIDPVAFRGDSVLGVPGLMECVRAGTVAICNAVGVGVVDDKSIYCDVPDLIRYFLAEEPILAQVPTYRPDRPGQMEEVLDRMESLVVKAVDGAGGYDILIGSASTEAERDDFARRIRQNPRGYIAQETVALSRAPVFLDGRFQPRHVDLRPFVMYGEEPKVVPGGLTRVALTEGSLVVNSSQGGGSKDTWALAPACVAPSAVAHTPRATRVGA